MAQRLLARPLLLLPPSGFAPARYARCVRLASTAATAATGERPSLAALRDPPSAHSMPSSQRLLSEKEREFLAAAVGSFSLFPRHFSPP